MSFVGFVVGLGRSTEQKQVKKNGINDGVKGGGEIEF